MEIAGDAGCDDVCIAPLGHDRLIARATGSLPPRRRALWRSVGVVGQNLLITSWFPNQNGAAPRVFFSGTACVFSDLECLRERGEISHQTLAHLSEVCCVLLRTLPSSCL